MNLLLVGKVEPFVIVWNWNRVEETLKIGIPVERVEKIFKGQRNIFRKGIEALDQQAYVGITGTIRGESVILQTNLELSGVVNLGGPILEVVVLELDWGLYDRDSLILFD